MQAPAGLKYTKSHEWLEVHGDGTATIGITDHAQNLLGDLVYVEVPEVGSEFNAGDPCAVVESVKAASDVYAPVSGEIVEVNDTLADSPETVNENAFADGWLFKIKLSNEAELDELLDADEYNELAESEDH